MFSRIDEYAVACVLLFTSKELKLGLLTDTMLSAFTARPVVELPQRNKSKIESVLAHGAMIVALA